MIAADNLRKHFKGRAILDGVSLTVASGEVVCLIGSSGGGKTTLLRCLNGLEPFDAGTVTVGSLTLAAGSGRRQRGDAREIRRRLGFVFQQWHLFAHRTALGNVLEGPIHVKKEPRAQALAAARALLESVGVGERSGAYPSELSGGEQQRVAIARALAMRPEGLLLDEPTSALDPERIAGLVTLLQRLAHDGLTLLIATHEIRFARQLASRVVVLDGGRIIEEGLPTEVLERPSHPRTRALLAHQSDL